MDIGSIVVPVIFDSVNHPADSNRTVRQICFTWHSKAGDIAFLFVQLCSCTGHPVVP